MMTLETLLYADWHYQHSAVLVKRRVDSGHAACTTIQAFNNPFFQQILYRLLSDLAGRIFLIKLWESASWDMRRLWAGCMDRA